MSKSHGRAIQSRAETGPDGRPDCCPHCGASREGLYCHSCGQRYLKSRLTLRELAWLFVERFLDWEQGIWPTYKGMMLYPGRVIGLYLDGERRRYINPFSYIVLCVLLFSGVRGLIESSEVATDIDQIGSVYSAMSTAQDDQSILVYGTVAIVVLLTPAIRMMFDLSVFNTTEALVTSLYASGNVFLLAIPVNLAAKALYGEPLTVSGLAAWSFLLFPLAMGHVGYHLFGSLRLAGFTAFVPFLAAILSGLVFFVGVYIPGMLLAQMSSEEGISAVGLTLAVFLFIAFVGPVVGFFYKLKQRP